MRRRGTDAGSGTPDVDRGTGNRSPGAERRVDDRNRFVGPTVLLVTGLALLVRLIGLGDRPFHWDEAYVGYWTLRYVETGIFEYRPSGGGTVLYLVGRRLLSLFDPSDALARLPVALVGGVLPATSLLFRDRLRDDETVLLAVVLGFSPLLVYYSRFLRGDLPLAAFALLAVGSTVRWIDRDDDRYLAGAAAAAALALASSGFAVATLVVVGIAALLAFDHRRVAGDGSSAVGALRGKWRFVHNRSRGVAVAAFALLSSLFVLFVPRGRGLAADPVGLFHRTYVTPVEAFVDVRVSSRSGTEFLPFVADAVGTLLATTGPLAAVALGGFLADRYGVLGRRPSTSERSPGSTGSSGPRQSARPIVMLTGFWAGLGLLAYPVASEVSAPWVLVHAAVPLSIPAAVGLAAIVRYGRRAAGRDDAARVGTAALLLLAVGLHGGIVVAEGGYGSPLAAAGGGTSVEMDGDAGPFAHSGQPATDLESLISDAETALAESDDDRVVWIGEDFYVAAEHRPDEPPVRDDREALAERLPLAWYVERTGAETRSVASADRLDGRPAVVIAAPDQAEALEERLDDHERREIELARADRELVLFLRA